MKNLNVNFEDEDFKKLQKLKNRMNLKWVEFILKLAKESEKLVK